MSSQLIGKVKLNTKNVEAYKVTMDDVITPYLYSELYNFLIVSINTLRYS